MTDYNENKNTIWKDYGPNREQPDYDPNQDKRMPKDKERRGYGGFIIFVCLVLIGAGWGFMAMTGIGLYCHINHDVWGIYTNVDGSCTILDEPGIRYRGTRDVYIYPRKFEISDTIEVTFADGVSGLVEVYMSGDIPENTAERIELHQIFCGLENLEHAYRVEARNVIRHTSPLMTAKESMSYKRAELNNLFYKQMQSGLFMRKNYQKNENDNFITSEFIKDDNGEYELSDYEPFSKRYGVNISKASITGIEYEAAFRQEVRGEEIVKNIIKKAKLELELELELAEIEAQRKHLEKDPNSG